MKRQHLLMALPGLGLMACQRGGRDFGEALDSHNEPIDLLAHPSQGPEHGAAVMIGAPKPLQGSGFPVRGVVVVGS